MKKQSKKPSKKPLHVKRIIGRRDRVDFPDLSLSDIDAKIDTGAYTTALHCANMQVFQRKNEPWVRFTLYDDELQVKHASKILAYRNVKSSSGDKEQRCIIMTRVRLFGIDYFTEVSLTNREGMKNPVLIGRKLLINNFIVDVSKTHLSYREKLKQTRNR
jgi:hypothetical protein